ncbi:MAG: hypothetical protein JNM39_01805 [Bdellovibrionaceae bacterium]|nr:hypothetical protein [Pseudobdellovibrionaceae bacterium]
MFSKMEKKQKIERPVGKCFVGKRLLIGALATTLGSFFIGCSFSVNNNQPVASKLPLPTSMKPATSQQKQALLEYAIQANKALTLVSQSSTEVAEVVSDISNYAPPTTSLSPSADYDKALTLAKENCVTRKIDEKTTDYALRSNQKLSRWSDNKDPNLKACGYNYLDVTDITSSEVPYQGILSTSGKSLRFDLNGVKEKLSQNDVLEVQYGVGTKTYVLDKDTQSGTTKDNRYLTQSSKSVSSTLTLVNGILVQVDLSETIIVEKIYVDDTLSRMVGSRTLTFLARLPGGDIGYEKKTQYLENGKSTTRIELNREVISEK